MLNLNQSLRTLHSLCRHLPRGITQTLSSVASIVTLHPEPVDVLLVVFEHRSRLIDGVHDARPGRLEELSPQADVVHLGLVLVPEVGRKVDG